MRTDMTRTYPVPLKKGFDYVDDFKTWPDWYVGMTAILEPEKGAWHTAGDEVRFAYKLLGRRLEGKAILDEYRDTELVKFHTEVPGLPVVHFEYHYREAGEAAFVLKVIMETEEPTSFFGKAIDRMLLPVALERDLRHSMENLDTIFTADLI
jgi:hypothetical protein